MNSRLSSKFLKEHPAFVWQAQRLKGLICIRILLSHTLMITIDLAAFSLKCVRNTKEIPLQVLNEAGAVQPAIDSQ